MPGGSFSKKGDWLGTKINQPANNSGDTVIGGGVATDPSLTVSQFFQTLPGDRLIFSPADAVAFQNNNVGLLFTGTYRYVATLNNSSSAPTRGHGAFWVDVTNANNNITDKLYQVSSDEAANFGVIQFAGVYINNITKGNYWWIQESGKATCAFRNVLTNTLTGGTAAAIGVGVYLAGAGNNNNAIDVGAFDVLAGANSALIFSAANSNTAYTTIDNMIIRYVGPALTVPANNATAIVDMVLNRASFRW